MKYLLWSVLLLLACRAVPAAETAVAADRRPVAGVFVSPAAIDAERFAAGELIHYLEASTGAVLPELAAVPEEGAVIFVGDSPEARERFPEAGWDAFRPDEIVVAARHPYILLAGERPRGAIYAVYEFLETRLGIRFWSAEAETVPQCEALAVEDALYRYAPPFPMREAFSFETNHCPALAVKLRNNGHYNLGIPEAMGGHYTYGIDFAHTFNLVLPPERYMDSHPEYFTLLYGNRQPAQLCLSNPDMRREFIKNVYEYMDAHPEQLLIALSQTDGALESHSCQCERCTRMRAELGGSTDMLISFINEVADAVAARNPAVRIETLAYSYTTEPPKTQIPRPQRHHPPLSLGRQCV